MIIFTDLESNSKTPFSRPISESCRCLSRLSSFIWATQVFPISHSGTRHIVCQYLKDGVEWVLSDQMANNQPGSKFCQYLMWMQVTSQGGGTFVSPPQVLPIWTIFNAATFTHRGKQGQAALQFGGKIQLNFLINFDALLLLVAGTFGHPSIDVFVVFLNLVCSQL